MYRQQIGRTLVLDASMEDKLKRRKLDALKRGVHRLSPGEALPVSTHAVGIGKSGAAAVAEMLRSLSPGAPKFTALVIDIGDSDTVELRTLAERISAERAEVTVLDLQIPSRAEFVRTFEHYPEFLTLEYPRYGRGADFEPWLTPSVALSSMGGHFDRAVAKAIYGCDYYGPDRALATALRRFAAGIEDADGQAVVALVFGLAGGTGSGIAVDVARHLSNRLFGRRVLVAGIGIAPCEGDRPSCASGQLFAVLNELDCLDDEGKNQGVVAACGELFRNPFTAGFIMVPQQHVWATTHDLAATNRRCAQEIAALVTCRDGAALWESLRLLNWVAAPSTQHSAARTPWGPNWIHMLGYADADPASPITLDDGLAGLMGLRPGYAPEFIEARAASLAQAEADRLATRLDSAFRPDVPPQIVDAGRAGSVQFILPSLSKTDLAFFYAARKAYDGEAPGQRLLDHSLLLEQGVLLSEPSTRLQGMAGASLGAGGGWIAVPLSDVRGAELRR